MSVRHVSEYATCLFALTRLCEKFSLSERRVSKREKKITGEALAVLKEAAAARTHAPIPTEYRSILKPFLDQNSRVSRVGAEVTNQSLVHFRRFEWKIN